MPAVETFFAVLDGQSPANWPVWGTTFGSVEQRVAALDSGQVLDLPVLDSLRPNLVMEPPGELLKRKSWSGVIGCIIDANARKDDGRLAEMRRIHTEICTRIKKGEGIYKRYGYQIISIVGDDSITQLEIERFAGIFWKDAILLFGEKVHTPQDAFDGTSLVQCMRQSLRQAVAWEFRDRARG
jgi:hypothetical protein